MMCPKSRFGMCFAVGFSADRGGSQPKHVSHSGSVIIWFGPHFIYDLIARLNFSDLKGSEFGVFDTASGAICDNPAGTNRDRSRPCVDYRRHHNHTL